MKQKKNIFIFLLSWFLTSFFNFKSVEGSPLKTGQQLFNENCAVCHLGGNNIIIPEKNLKKEALEENGMNSITSISYQILNGKNGMPAFGGRLNEVEIETIAMYVIEESQNNFIK